jgi:hypothetical protein
VCREKEDDSTNCIKMFCDKEVKETTFLSNKYIINEAVVYKEIINCSNVAELRNI